MMKSFCRSLIVPVLLGMLLGTFAPQAQAEEFSRYEITATLDPKTHTLSGTQKIDYLNDTVHPLEEIIFVLMANQGREQNPYIHPALQDPQYVKGFDPTWTKILSVKDGAGQPLEYQLEAVPPFFITYSLEDNLLRVRLPQPLEPKGRTTVVIEFKTKFAQGLTADNNVYRGIYTWRFAWNPLAYPEESGEQEKFELPAAFYRVELTVPQEFVVAAGVERQEVTSQGNEWQTILLESDVPTRSVPLVIGRDLKRYRLFWRDIVIDSYYLPGGEGYGRLAAAYAAEILEYHSEKFGPFAYKRLVIVENPTPGLFGMGADAMILIGTSNYRLKDVPALGILDRFLEYLIAHELAHLWWGIGVGVDFNAENWLSEGFAEYLAFSYFEDKYGGFEPNLFAHLGKGLLEELFKSQFGYLNLRRHLEELPYLDLLCNRFDEAIVKPMSEVEYYNGQTVRIYNKGYLVLRALEGLLGREAMLQVLREAYTRYNHLIPTVEDFRRIAEELSGQDLEEFFTSWLYGADVLDIAVDRFESREVADGYKTTVYLKKRGEAIFPVIVKAITADGQELEATWSGDSAEGTVTFATPSPVKRIHVDPGELSLDMNRFNNHLPRRVILKHLFLKEGWKIGQPLDAYLISLSPTGITGGFRNDHLWGLSVAPLVTMTDEEEQEEEEPQLLWEAVGLFIANLDRGLSLDASAALSEYDPKESTGSLDAQVGVNLTRFEHPPIGVTARYWWPANLFRVSAGMLGNLPHLTGFVGLDYARSDILKYYMYNAFSLRLGLPVFDRQPFAQLEWGGFKRFRLAHLLYLDADLSVGTGLFGLLPEPFQFSLGRLHSFDEDFPNDRGVFGRLQLQLPPLVRDLGYLLLNLARVDSLQAGLFVQGGQTWAWDEAIELSDPKVEAGVGATVMASSFLGLPLGLMVGYAHPILGAEPDAMGNFFVRFSSAF